MLFIMYKCLDTTREMIYMIVKIVVFILVVKWENGREDLMKHVGNVIIWHKLEDRTIGVYNIMERPSLRDLKWTGRG